MFGVGSALAPTTRNSPAAFQPAEAKPLGAVALSVSTHRPWPVLGSTKVVVKQLPALGESVTVIAAVAMNGDWTPGAVETIPPARDQRPSAPVVVVPAGPPVGTAVT